MARSVTVDPAPQEAQLTVFIGWSRSANIVRNLVIRLKVALESIDLPLFYGFYPDILIWILFLGGDSSAGPLERAWFVSQLVIVVTPSKLRQWKDVRDSLLGFFYLDSAHQGAFQVLWAEVQIAVALS
jgi:hypothetical protein